MEPPSRCSLANFARSESFSNIRLRRFPGDEQLSAVWGRPAAVPTMTVDMHIAILRRKLEDDP